MPNTLKKTAVIGIGGTGMHAVLHMKRKLLDIYGEIPPMMKFLVIDTTDADSLEGKDGKVTLDPGEFLKLEVRNPPSLIQTNREVQAWIPENIPRTALTAGAKQVRPLGRLAVFANSAPLEARLDGLISSVRDFRLARSDKYELISDSIVVSVVCSISGGTGAGAYLDVAVITRAQLASTDKLIGYFLLPDIFVGKPATENVEPNAYAALKEISHFSDTGKLRYSLGGRTRTLDGGLFNAIYLVNKTNKNGIEYNDLNDLREFLGTGLFLQSTTTGKGASDIIDNLEAELIGKRWFGQPTIFSSFGISELVYPGEWYADLYTNKIALASIEQVFLGGDVSGAAAFTDDFIRRAQIRERNADDVLDSIADPHDVRSFTLPKEFRKELIAATFARRDTYISEIQALTRDTALKQLSELKAAKTAFLADELAARLSSPQSLEFSRSFLASLAGQLSEFRKEMNDERDQLDRERGELVSRYDGARAEADAAAKAIFNSKAKIESALRKLKQLSEREARLYVELERREKAIDFFSHMLHEIARWTERLGALREYCTVLTEEFAGEVQRIHHDKREIRPFVHEVKPQSLTDDVADRPAEDFVRWLREERGQTVLDLAELRLATLKTVLLDYGAADPAIQAVRQKSIDDILREVPAEERANYIGLLDRMAAPLWQYDQGTISGEKRTTSIYLFGVADSTNTVVVPEQIRTAIQSPYPPSVVSTGDTKRIVCLKVEAAVPAFVVHNVPRYRERYLPPGPFSYHLHRAWRDELPDLAPATEEAESRKFWSLGLADPFKLILKRGQHYYVRSENKGERTKEYLVRLAQGRAEAMRVFVADPDLVDEIKDAIDRINEQLGNNAIIEGLRTYGSELERQAGRQSEDVRRLIESELGDLEAYIRSLTAL